MKKISAVSLFIIVIAVATVFLWRGMRLRNTAPEPVALPTPDAAILLPEPTSVEDNNASDQNNNTQEPVTPTNSFQWPLDRDGERLTKKTFGMFITPQNSPVQPEKFQGYHTGIDLETFPEELDATVAVRAVCGGKMLVKKSATGYGGVVVQSCNLAGQPVTVVYGHLKLTSISSAAGDAIAVGDELGVLGVAYSAETGGERKHLHLGIHKGAAINILGYVHSKTELSDWIDPVSLLGG